MSEVKLQESPKPLPKELQDINNERYVNFARLGELTAMYDQDKQRFVAQELALAAKFKEAKEALDAAPKAVEAEVVE